MHPMPTALFRTTDLALADDVRYQPVGTLLDGSVVIHAEHGAPVPEDAATVYFDGSAPWTWGEFALAFPLVAPFITPHEWAGDPIAGDATPALFPKIAGAVL